MGEGGRGLDSIVLSYLGSSAEHFFFTPIGINYKNKSHQLSRYILSMNLDNKKFGILVPLFIWFLFSLSFHLHFFFLLLFQFYLSFNL